MTDFMHVVTTTDTREHASKIGRYLLDCRLGGCVQVSGPITSSYWWKGKIEESEEWHCVIKTATEKYEEVERAIRLIHTYEEPEIIAIPVLFGSESYLAWLRASLTWT